MIRIFREPSDGAKRQKVVCDITREHPAEICVESVWIHSCWMIFDSYQKDRETGTYKVSRDVIFTLQKKLFNYDSNEWL